MGGQSLSHLHNNWWCNKSFLQVNKFYTYILLAWTDSFLSKETDCWNKKCLLTCKSKRRININIDLNLVYRSSNSLLYIFYLQMQYIQFHIFTYFLIQIWIQVQFEIIELKNLNSQKKNKDEFVKFSIIFIFVFFYLPSYNISNLQYFVNNKYNIILYYIYHIIYQINIFCCINDTWEQVFSYNLVHLSHLILVYKI